MQFWDKYGNQINAETMLPYFQSKSTSVDFLMDALS